MDRRSVAGTGFGFRDRGVCLRCAGQPHARGFAAKSRATKTGIVKRGVDEEALLSTLAYVDLNPLAAGIAKSPERSPHTSIKARIKHARTRGTLKDTVNQPADRTRQDTLSEDESFWLVPIQERREAGGLRAGMSTGMNLAGYLRLLDWTARLGRPGKTHLPRDVADILQRLGSSPDLWHHRLTALQKTSRIFGVAFATKAESLNRMAEARGVTKLANVSGGCG